MDTVVGFFNLTKNQQTHLPTIPVHKIKGFGYWHDTGKFVAVSQEPLTEEEKKKIQVFLTTLPDVPCENVVLKKNEKKRKKLDVLKKMGLDAEDAEAFFELIKDVNLN